jgi:ERCC4-like helicases
VPEVDLVLFFEPVPTGIRSIQRKGRTGRQEEGRVVVLMAEDTRDEAYFWISRRKERKMEEELRSLKSVADEISEELSGQSALDQFDDASEDDAGEGGDVDTEEPADTTNGDDQPGLTTFDADDAGERVRHRDDHGRRRDDYHRDGHNRR